MFSKILTYVCANVIPEYTSRPYPCQWLIDRDFITIKKYPNPVDGVPSLCYIEGTNELRVYLHRQMPAFMPREPDEISGLSQ